MSARLHTGLPKLDDLLGGGLLPDTLTVIAGATGIGKTQLGLHFARQGLQQEGQAGVILDLSSRGDSQSQAEYAERMFDWKLQALPITETLDSAQVWDASAARRDYLHVFERSGRRVTRKDLDFEDYQEWKIELAKKLQTVIQFFYGNFIHGVRRCVIDGIEPVDTPSESFQFDLIEYIYHQVLHKESDWVARDLFREKFRSQSELVMQHLYPHTALGCVLLLTTHEVMLDELVERRLDTGDILSNANTIIYLGKTRSRNAMGRALHVAKHRSSRCGDELVPFTIESSGLQIG